MYVQEVILEGFKTYMNRTVVSGFDPQFNAITGLNGSGKSNILDAIQFLLGSTSKEMLRLKTGLTQLIYKQGFAGIEKASVTIRFRCPEKTMRPIGFEQSEQLIVTRQITKDKITKFFVNGQNSNLTKVRNLFRSVQLNIQNPHFLVKQGQITKIINLKPVQLLGMIEETAGTAYYNKTRTQSEKIISRKEQKLESINQILQNTIKPQMEKLQIDRKKYAAFKEKQTLADRLSSKIKLHEYAVKILETRNKQYRISALKENHQRKLNQIRELGERVIQVQNQIRILKNRSQHQSVKDYNNMKSLLLQKQNTRKNIRNRLQIIQEQSLKMKQDAQNNQRELQRLKQEIQWYQKQAIQTEHQIQEYQGLAAELEKSNSEQEAQKLMRKQLAQQEATVKSLQQEIKILTSKRQSIKKEQQQNHKNIQQAKEGLISLQKTLQGLNNEIQAFQKMQKPVPIQDPQIGAQELKKLQNDRRRLIQQNFRLCFNFNDPYPGFNRSLVKGKLFMIFSPKDRIHEKALEIGAGVRLFNVVVENQTASQALLKAQSFGPNITLIPNNKIRPALLKPEAVNYANQIVKELGGLAKPAFELINYPQNLKNSILFAFGNFMICSSSELAKRIAFNPNRNLSCRCVTYDGDIYQQGTLTGGSDGNQQFILPKWQIMKEIQGKIQKERQTFQKKQKQFQNFKNKLEQYRSMERDQDNKKQRRQKVKQKLSSLAVNTKPKDFSEELQSIQKRVKNLTKQLQDHQKKVFQLKSKGTKGSINSVAQQKKSLAEDKRKCERKLAEGKKKISLNEVQIDRIFNDQRICEANERDYQKELVELERAQNSIIDEIKEARVKFEELEAKKLRIEKQLAVNQNSIQLLQNEGHQLKKKQQEEEEVRKSLAQDIQNFDKQVSMNEKILQNLLRENPWLQNQQATEVDPDFRYEEAVREHNQLLIEVDKLRKTVKVNVDDHSYQKLTQQYKDLLDKKSILQNDKVTLLTNMHQLDDKRTKTLQKCFLCVKQNLGSIFNDLLPGATAHLNLIDQYDVTKGAQLRVHFNDVKKQLSELSGGQRSLLALSFILALLLYKPSPFYILDQIDSALDLSHTENIGYMISKRFPQSQFILISLKEGMYQNANVLYRVHFADGQSKVDRQVLKKKN